MEVLALPFPYHEMTSVFFWTPEKIKIASTLEIFEGLQVFKATP